MNELRTGIEAEAKTLAAALNSATEAATHSENKAENKYDTRGLEAAYLAGAQGERLAILQSLLVRLQHLPLRDFAANDRVALTALVELSGRDGAALYWLLPVAGGYVLQTGRAPVQTLTPETPLGRALLGKEVGDLVAIGERGRQREYELVAID